MLIPKYYESLDTLHVGTEENRSYYVPYRDLTSAFNNCKTGQRAVTLSGKWSFKYYDSAYKLKDEFWRHDAADGDYDIIPVPSTWQTLGYESNIYTNVRYPFPFDPPYVPSNNPCGAYKTTFSVPTEAENERKYLYFEGVDSCFYVWVNGEFVGYSQVSHSSSEFEITKFVRAGDNDLSVLVLKWCTGSYLEDQDKLRYSGIFRDVSLIFRPSCHIRDFFVTTELFDSYSRAQVKVDLEWSGGLDTAKVSLYDGRKTLLDSKMAADTAIFGISKPVLWNAEQPNLYYITIETGDECICQHVGIREVKTENGVLLLNGVPIKLKGVNRHDSDPFTGPVISEEQLLTDLRLMKQHNINAIRTSHYPNAPWATLHYDRLGFYVIDEADLETHGTTTIYGGGSKGDYNKLICEDKTFGMLCHMPEFKEAMVDRTQRNVIRDKNCPSVIMWSLGNESGYGPNLEAAAKWAKEYDPGRLVHYESSIYQMPGYTNDLSNIDVFSRMYAPTEAINRYFTENMLEVPFIQCEFSHAMGNGPGDLEDYYEQIYKYDGFAGAFVWEWCDHAMYQGTTPEGKEKFGYGGDFNEFPHDGNFCMDGLVYPNRTPHTGLAELKNVARPARVVGFDTSAGMVELRNCMDFVNLKDYIDVEVQVSEDGVVTSSYTVDNALLDIPAHKTAKLPLNIKSASAKNCYINLIYTLREASDFMPAGFVVGHDQLELKSAPVAAPEHQQRNLAVAETDTEFIVSGDGLRYVFNRLTGTFDSMVNNGLSILTRPMEYNIWRAPADNDRNIRHKWEAAGYDRHTVRVYSSEAVMDGSDVVINVTLSISAIFIQRILDVTAQFTVKADGKLVITIDAERNLELPFLPRFGLRLFLPKGFESAEYFGYGPFESYVDKRRASMMGIYSSSLEGLHEDYIMPQENGSHCNCKFIRLRDGLGSTISAYGENFSFSASHYSQEELTAKMHNYELMPSDEIILCLDYKMSGVGSNSCGPELLSKYRLEEKEIHWQITIDAHA